MIKVETRKIDDNIVAIAIEASREDDLTELDVIYELLSGPYESRGGYVNTKRFVIEYNIPHVEETS